MEQCTIISTKEHVSILGIYRKNLTVLSINNLSRIGFIDAHAWRIRDIFRVIYRMLRFSKHRVLAWGFGRMSNVSEGCWQLFFCKSSHTENLAMAFCVITWTLDSCFSLTELLLMFGIEDTKIEGHWCLCGI